MKIGDEVYVHGYVDEIRGDTVIIRNGGGYFGTLESEVKTDPVKHGRWIGEADGYADGELVYDMWYCSACDYLIEDDEEPTFHYCPNCGAKMDEVEE